MNSNYKMVYVCVSRLHFYKAMLVFNVIDFVNIALALLNRIAFHVFKNFTEASKKINVYVNLDIMMMKLIYHVYQSVEIKLLLMRKIVMMVTMIHLTDVINVN